MPILRIWLYRVGMCGVDANSRRFMSSETWLSLDDHHGAVPSPTLFRGLGQRLRVAFGAHPGLDYHHIANAWSEELYPHPRILEAPFLFPQTSPPQLNAAAPEASVVLRRVGSGGSGGLGAGRILLPLLDDTYYTDLPHRRHINAATLQGFINSNLALQPLVVTASGKTYTNVIFHRKDHTWTAVDHYEVLPRVGRVWQRFRTYNYAARHTADATWSGPFF